MVLIPGKEETGPDPRRRYRLFAIPVGAALLAELALIAARRGGTSSGPGGPGGVEAIGRLLFTDYLFPFELTSVLLLAAMVGVMLLSKRTSRSPVPPTAGHPRPAPSSHGINGS
jgi:NADH-quinone oxidoreductase subunit J